MAGQEARIMGLKGFFNGIWMKIRTHFKDARTRYLDMPLIPDEEKKRDRVKMANIFMVIALVCGLLISFILPPLCSPDENVHFVHAYDISRGNLFAEVHEGRIVRFIPDKVNQFVNKYPISMNGIQNGNRYNHLQMFYDSYNGDDLGEPVVYPISSGTAGYGIAALSMRIVSEIGNLLKISKLDNPYNLMLAGRIGNLLFYTLLIFFAIRRAPHFYRFIMLIGLMPMSLFLGASLNYDAIIIPISLYFVALVLDLSARKEEKLTGGEILRVLLCAALLAELKQGLCAPLLILLLTIPIKKYGSVRKLIFCIVAVIAAAIVGYIPNIINGRIDASVHSLSEAVSTSQLQQQWVASNMSQIPNLLKTTFEVFFSGYVTMFWGVLGWLDVYIPAPVMTIGYIMLLITALYEGCTFNIWRKRRWKNILSFIGAVVSALAVFMSMYFFFTQVTGYYVVEGVQGRYFIPIALPMLLAFSNSLLLYCGIKTDEKSGKVLSTAVSIWGGCCASVTVFILIARYWLG